MRCGAVELGVTLIDTAPRLRPGVQRGAAPLPRGSGHRDQVRDRQGGSRDQLPRRPTQAIRTICEASLRQLRLETIDLLQLHWVDEDTPIEESVGAMLELVRQGKVRHVGISNVTLDEFERARATGPIASVQNRFSRARSPTMVRIPGTRSAAHLEENVGAAAIRLSAEEARALSAM